jgi:hypothetical protein
MMQACQAPSLNQSTVALAKSPLYVEWLGGFDCPTKSYVVVAKFITNMN